MSIFSGPLRSWRGMVPFSAALVLIVLLAVVQGRWSDRWGDPGADARKVAVRLQDIPLNVGNWEGSDSEADLRELEAAGAVGHVTRVYRNKVTGTAVSLYLICGHSRDISVHTPDRCYPAAGFEKLARPSEFKLTDAGAAAEFQTTTFRKEETEGIRHVRVFWTWSEDGQWTAPTAARRAFAGVPALFKLYFIGNADRAGRPLEETAPISFAREALPVINDALFSAPPDAETPTTAGSPADSSDEAA